MDPVKQEIIEGCSTPLLDRVEPPWSMKEEAQDQPSAVDSTVQPMSDISVNTSGSLLSLNTSPVCQYCSTAFVLVSSLELHMASLHGEPLPFAESTVLPVFSAPQCICSKNCDEKQEPPWSMKEEPQDQPSAVDSTVQPMSDDTSGSLLSLNTSPVCERRSASFVHLSSLEQHMEFFHDTLPDMHTGTGRPVYCPSLSLSRPDMADNRMPPWASQLMKMMSELLVRTRKMERMLRVLILRTPSDALSDGEVLPEGIRFPLTTMDDLLRADQLLADPAKEKAVLNVLRTVGGSRVKEAATNVLRRMFGPKGLSEQLCWTGSYDKARFKDLNLRTVLCKAVRLNPRCRDATDDEVKRAAQDFFRSVKDRLGGRDARRRAKEEERL